MQKFALALFKDAASAMLYQTAIFSGFFGDLIERKKPRMCCALSNRHFPAH